jgi:exopolysaccharide biosynthesis polyprenyl glycosylphosphotransferase
MLVSVASITPIDVRRGGGDASPIDALPVPPFSAEDLVEAVDDHTRLLLQRQPRARRRRILPPLLMLADVVGLSLAYLFATLLSSGDGALGSSRELLLFVLSLPAWILVAHLHGLYHRDEERTDHSTSDDIVGVFHLVTLGVWLLVVASRIGGQSGPRIVGLVAFWLLAIALIPLARKLAREGCKQIHAYEQNTVIVGAGDIGQLIGRKLIKHREYGANVVGFVDRLPKMRRPDLPEHLSILGGPDRLPEIIERLDVERVVIAFPHESVSELLALLRRLRPLGVQIDLVPWLFELIGPRVSVHTVEGLPLIGLPPTRHSRSALLVKRMIDIVGASIGLIVAAPLMIYIAIRIARDSPGPILFRQTRLGAGMNEFSSLKFRTMKVDTDPTAHREYISRTMLDTTAATASGLYKLDQSKAITDVGRWLRRTSLDELPQLFNVLRGEMSLVGPRPCIPYEVEHFASYHMERFLMPQGLTGLWQVTARANSTYAEALEMDVAYVRGWSLGLDLRLLLRTPLQVIRQRASTT